MGKEKKPDLYVAGGKRGWYKLRYVGLYDENALFGTIRGYLFTRGYFVINKDQTEAIKPSGRKIELEWEAIKDVTFYLRYFITVEIIIQQGADVIVEEHGTKKRKLNAIMEIRIKAKMAKNANGAFPGTKFGDYLREIYEKYLVKDYLKKMEDRAEAETYGLIDQIKRVLPGVRAA